MKPSDQHLRHYSWPKRVSAGFNDLDTLNLLKKIDKVKVAIGKSTDADKKSLHSRITL